MKKNKTIINQKNRKIPTRIMMTKKLIKIQNRMMNEKKKINTKI